MQSLQDTLTTLSLDSRVAALQAAVRTPGCEQHRGEQLQRARRQGPPCR